MCSDFFLFIWSCIFESYKSFQKIGKQKEREKKEKGSAELQKQLGPASKPAWPAQAHCDIAVTSPVGGRCRGAGDHTGVSSPRFGVRG